MTKRYVPRPGSYVAKAVQVLWPLEGRMLSSGTLARMIGCRVTAVRTVLHHGLLHRAIACQRSQSGWWYGIGDLYADQPASAAERAQAEHFVRQLPPSSVFDLGAPARVLPRRTGREPAVKSMVASKARYAFWSDGAVQIQKGEVAVTLDPDEYRELVAGPKAREGIEA